MDNNSSHNNNFTSGNLPGFQTVPNVYNGVNASCNYTDDFSLMKDDTPVNNNNTNQDSIYSNENVVPTSHSANGSHVPQYIGQQILYQNSPQPIGNVSSPPNSLNMVNSTQANNSEIFGFDIPGFKIITIPISSPTSLNMTHHYSLDIPGFKIIIIPIATN
ncbi:hypothetical protein RhiirA4_507246 [Rhizophagus irregularis]|uniref:Uncharacterized protein n=1 Tax=Rhizophagus irregularis TaxID=588596 RepID=A0A2I1HC25_9GLOM|nr:hypothetical protein RhiirA4_507246 [Rhizophagus irregularis]